MKTITHVIHKDQFIENIRSKLLESSDVILEDIYLEKQNEGNVLTYQFFNLSTKARDVMSLAYEPSQLAISLKEICPAAIPLEEQLECVGKVFFEKKDPSQIFFRKEIE